MAQFNGLGMSLGNLSRLSNAETRSISPENLTGEKGKGAMATEGSASVAARDLGQGWKVNPYVIIEPGATFELAEHRRAGRDPADLDDARARQVALLDPARVLGRPGAAVDRGADRRLLRVRLGELRAGELAAGVREPGARFNCYWEMPFRKRARFTMTNLSDEPLVVYYQINYTLTEVPDDCAYFHAQFRRTNPLPYKEVYTILDGVRGQGHYAGVYMAWGVNNNGWWGEGEIKFYLDGDARVPDDRGHRHRGLLLRRVQLRSGLARAPPAPGRVALPGVHDGVRGAAAGDPARRRLPVAAALRHVPLARDGPGALPARPPRHHPGARLAHAPRAAVPAAAGRHRVVRVLVPDAADRAVPAAAAPRPARGDLTPESDNMNQPTAARPVQGPGGTSPTGPLENSPPM